MKPPVHSPVDTFAPAYPPRGLGVYLTSGDVMQKEPAREAPRMADAGLRWAAVFVEAPDGRHAPTPRLVSWCAAIRAHGLTPLLWTFPRPNDATAITRALAALGATMAAGLVLDIERDPQQRGEEWTATGAAKCIRAAIDGISERHSLGVTSYPSRQGHQLPWDELAAGYGAPQLYRSADDPSAITRSLSAYRDAHGVVVPVIDSYLGDHERLRSVALRVADAGPTSIGVWAWGTCDGRERRVLGEVAARLGW